MTDECNRCGSVGGFGCYECTPDMIPRAEAERMAQEARAAALEEALNKVSGCDRVSEVGPAIRALLDTPAAEALERVRAEEREACFAAAQNVAFVRIADLQADNAEADDPDGVLDKAVSLSEAMLRAIRAPGET